MADNCDRCRQLEQQVKRLEERNRRLLQRIERAQQVCAQWHNRCQRVKAAADVVLDQKSGVRRAVYGYQKGVSGGVKYGICGLSEVYHALEEG